MSMLRNEQQFCVWRVASVFVEQRIIVPRLDPVCATIVFAEEIYAYMVSRVVA